MCISATSWMTMKVSCDSFYMDGVIIITTSLLQVEKLTAPSKKV